MFRNPCVGVGDLAQAQGPGFGPQLWKKRKEKKKKNLLKKIKKIKKKKPPCIEGYDKHMHID